MQTAEEILTKASDILRRSADVIEYLIDPDSCHILDSSTDILADLQSLLKTAEDIENKVLAEKFQVCTNCGEPYDWYLNDNCPLCQNHTVIDYGTNKVV